MEIIPLLIIVSLVVAAGFLAVFMWAVRDGQYDDSETPAMKILIEEDMIPNQSKND